MMNDRLILKNCSEVVDLVCLKGLVHPKMKIIPYFPHPQVILWLSSFSQTQSELFI